MRGFFMLKIFSLSDFIQFQLYKLRFFDKKIVFTNGCFDIVHNGHLDYLKKSSLLGDILIVGLNSDDSVSRLKGTSRPINNFQSRSTFLSYLSFVDFIIPFDDDTPYNLIQAILPDVLVKGADYSIENIVGADIVLANGGEVITIELLSGYSTTSIINKIKF